MSIDKAIFRKAEQRDAREILAFMKKFYSEDGYRCHPERADYNMKGLIDNRDWGRVFVLEAQNGDIAGYMIIVFGFSMEYQGRDAYIDELYITEPFRGAGYGTKGLDLVEETCRQAGIRALHLEVEKYKDKAITLYKSRGFFDRGRFLMTKWIDGEEH
jgi:ribosomal protein S18 acetylase RimI-like enzyme